MLQKVPEKEVAPAAYITAAVPQAPLVPAGFVAVHVPEAGPPLKPEHIQVAELPADGNIIEEGVPKLH